MISWQREVVWKIFHFVKMSAQVVWTIFHFIKMSKLAQALWRGIYSTRMEVEYIPHQDGAAMPQHIEWPDTALQPWSPASASSIAASPAKATHKSKSTILHRLCCDGRCASTFDERRNVEYSTPGRDMHKKNPGSNAVGGLGVWDPRGVFFGQ